MCCTFKMYNYVAIISMVMSWHGNAFHINERNQTVMPSTLLTLCESDRWIHLQRASNAELWCTPEQTVNQTVDLPFFVTPWRSCNVTVMMWSKSYGKVNSNKSQQTQDNTRISLTALKSSCTPNHPLPQFCYITTETLFCPVCFIKWL